MQSPNRGTHVTPEAWLISGVKNSHSDRCLVPARPRWKFRQRPPSAPPPASEYTTIGTSPYLQRIRLMVGLAKTLQISDISPRYRRIPRTGKTMGSEDRPSGCKRGRDDANRWGWGPNPEGSPRTAGRENLGRRSSAGLCPSRSFSFVSSPSFCASRNFPTLRCSNAEIRRR
jgi:hypothetical protein